MPKFADLKIIYKILGCFGLIAIVSVSAIWFTTSRMSAIDKLYSDVIEGDVKAAISVTRATAVMTTYRLAVWRLIALTDEAGMRQAVEDKNASAARFATLVELAKKQAPAAAAKLDSIRARFETLAPQYKKAEELALANKNAEATAVVIGMGGQMGDLQKQFIALGEELVKGVDVASDGASATVVQTVNWTYVTVGSAMAIMFVIAFLVVQKMIVGPITRLVPELNKLADGDFNVTLTSLGRKDEIGQISAAVEMVVDKVGSTIGNIKLSATEVTSASSEISTSTSDLSQRTEEQAASLEETSASMAEISDTVRKNAENARNANEYATETSSVAERGGAVVSEAVTAMSQIEESSRKIGDIIGVIDEIARQTNLLALNAAVEAARAGEAGRGFAVVASEVRSLAQRSSQAAKDIKDLIVSSNSQVKNGVELVNKAGESLSEITASVKKVAAVVADIANASIEQSTGIEQINRALTQMDEVTQQNSALVEENAATAKTLETQAKSMDERVAMFRLRADERTVSVRQQPAAAPRAVAPVQLKPVAKPAPVAARPAAVRRAGGGSAGRMQTALATAVNADADWKDF